ncbi:MAG: Gfo/Idh/MocA family oxidoreductase, partial [Candidatus Promineifilaceae bacterium]
MKPQLPIWVALTFLMLILVLFAALVFMFQGRYTLEDQIGALQGEATKSAETVTGLESATTTEAVVMADAEATLSAMEANAEVAQGQMDKLNATSLEMAASATAAVQLSLDEAAATLDATIHQPPLLKVQGIVDGDAFDPNTDVNLVISASDPQGIETVSVSVNGEPLAEIAGEGEMLVAEVVMWNSAEDGNYTFELNATDGDGMASAPLVLMVEVVDREARLQALVVEIQGEVEEIRGLEFTEPVTLTLYTEAELRENFEEIFGDDVSEEEARDSVLEYYAFDFLDKDYDLYSELIDLYSGSVLGFYDPDTEAAQELSQTLQYPYFESIEALIEAVDVVDIVTPTLSHFDVAKKAIKQGKHVFIEKP